MIEKAHLLEENNELKRKIYILENIGVTIFSSVKDKEIAAEKFLKDHPDYNLYEVTLVSFLMPDLSLRRKDLNISKSRLPEVVPNIISL